MSHLGSWLRTVRINCEMDWLNEAVLQLSELCWNGVAMDTWIHPISFGYKEVESVPPFLCKKAFK